MKALAAAIAVLSLLLLSGCIGTSRPENCSTYLNAQLQDQCVSDEAVLAQSPSICYYISNITLRESCLIDSNSEDARAALESGRTPGEVYVPPQDIVAVPSKPSTNNSATDAVQMCMETKKLSQEACMRSLAIAAKNMSMCQDILSGEYRESCIANIAIARKKVSDCAILVRDSDRLLCRSYTGG
jgi:hypothetical protein